MSLDDNRHKVPPQNLEAESSVLGAIILVNESINLACEILKPDDFYRESHQKIFRAMIELTDRGEPIDVIQLSECLKNRGELDALGGSAYLASLVDFVPTAANIASYGQIVRNKAKLRSVIRAAEDIAFRGYEEQGNVEEFLEMAGKAFAFLKNGNNGNGHAPDAFNNVVFLKAADIKPKKLKWLWHSRIPLGKVTVLDGDPGLAKSLMSIDIAACVTTGRAMPNSAVADLPEAAGVVFLSAEDDPEDTIQPRLVLAGADLNRVVLLTGIKDGGGVSLPTISNLPEIRQMIAAVGAKLVVIDPLMAYLCAETNSYRDQDIRRGLAPLAALAAELAVAILVIRHLNKSFNNNPLYRGGGSIGIIGAARSGLLVVKHPDDDSRCILSVAKSNLAKLPASLAYEVLSNAEEIPFINWLGTTQQTAASLLQDQAEGEEERSAVRDAEDFLSDYLKLMPRKWPDVRKAALAAGIAEKTLKRAKVKLKVWSKQDGFHGGWFWGLPEQSTQWANDDTVGQNGDL